MPDHARSDLPGRPGAARPAVGCRSPGADILGLERITALLARLGNPHERLPPVFHVAGTNGKGSTCAFLRAALEAAGYTRPRLFQPASRPLQRTHPPRRHADRGRGARGAARGSARCGRGYRRELLRSHHRRRLPRLFAHAGRRLRDRGRPRRPARRDQRHRRPGVCGIAQLGIDHEASWVRTRSGIAREKAGIAKPGRPLVISNYAEEITRAIARGCRFRRPRR